MISQSGETADTLAAMREAKRLGARTLSIVNVVGSSIANESDDVIYTWAGPEIAVATTKAYSTQLAVVYLLAIYHGEIRRGAITAEELVRPISQSCRLCRIKLKRSFKIGKTIQYLASQHFNAKDVFFIGRNLRLLQCPWKGSLKLKEISYIHSDAYAAGELKHGTISLVEDGTLVIASGHSSDMLFDKMMSNVKEVKAQRCGCAGNDDGEAYTQIEQVTDHVFYIPQYLMM